MDIAKLKELGLTDNEAKVYAALFHLGSTRAGAIIKITKLVRNSVYLALGSLVSKKLVKKTVDKGVYIFEAFEPTAFLDFVEEKKHKAERLVDYLGALKPKVSRDIKVYEGMENILFAREKALKLVSGETMYLLGGSKFGSLPEMESYWRRFHAKRVAKKIKFKILYDRTAPDEYILWRKHLPLTEVRYLPEVIESPTWFEVYGDYAGIGIPGDEPTMIVVRSKDTAASLVKYFNYLWERGQFINN